MENEARRSDGATTLMPYISHGLMGYKELRLEIRCHGMNTHDEEHNGVRVYDDGTWALLSYKDGCKKVSGNIRNSHLSMTICPGVAEKATAYREYIDYVWTMKEGRA